MLLVIVHEKCRQLRVSLMLLFLTLILKIFRKAISLEPLCRCTQQYVIFHVVTNSKVWTSLCNDVWLALCAVTRDLSSRHGLAWLASFWTNVQPCVTSSLFTVLPDGTYSRGMPRSPADGGGKNPLNVVMVVGNLWWWVMMTSYLNELVITRCDIIVDCEQTGLSSSTSAWWRCRTALMLTRSLAAFCTFRENEDTLDRRGNR